MTALQAADASEVLSRTGYVVPQGGQELVSKGLLALGVVIVGIMIYLAIRFEW